MKLFQSWMRVLASSFVLGVLSITSVSLNAAPTEAQLELFNSLPKDQQQALLKQQGIGGTASAPTQQKVEPVLDTVKPVKKVVPVETTEAVVVVDEQKAIADFQGFSSETQQVKLVALERFGASLFAGQPTTFAPVNDIPVPTDYILGPGDQIKIQLYGVKNENYQLVIDRSGQVVFPSIGPINLAGLSLSDATAVLQEKIKTLGVGINSNITLGDLRSFRIFVMGEARVPGSYLVSGMATMTHALYVSGGIADIGSFRNIQLKRRGKLIATLDLYDLLISGNTKDDARLQPGDTVFIPVLGKTAAIGGQVKRPAVYEIKNERNFQDLIALSGGLTSEAYLKEAKVTRVTQQGYATIETLNLAKKRDLVKTLRDGDVLRVDGLDANLDRVVNIGGAVKRPGVFPWNSRQTVLDVLPSLDSFDRNADLDYLVILRQNQTGGAYSALSFSWSQIINKQAPDIRLQSRDRLFVFSKFSVEKRNKTLEKVAGYLQQQASLEAPAAVVELNGLVRFPGDYPLTNQLTLEQAISAAGGLLPKADINYLLLQRENKATGRISFEQYTLSEAKSVTLSSQDRVYVYSLEAKNRSKVLESVFAKMRAQTQFGQAAEIFQISGLVKSSGYFPLTPEINLSQAIAAAGGLLPKADMNYVLVQSEDRLTGRISFQQYKLNEAEQLVLKPQDHVRIYSIEDTNRSEVLADVFTKMRSQTQLGQATAIYQINGFVRSSGVFPLTPEINLSQAIAAAGGLLPKADIDYLLIQSEDTLTGRISFQQYKLNEAEKVFLKPKDHIRIYSIEDKSRSDSLVDVLAKMRSQTEVGQPAQVYKINGLVNSPGSYPLTSELTLSQAIAAAGGLKYQALQTEADLIRVQIKEGEQLVSSQMQVDLAGAMKGDVNADLVLRPGDKLIVKQIADWNDTVSQIELQGEVRYPGVYNFTPGETLGAVIDRAGGYTQWAEPKSAVFIRESLKTQEARELKSLADELEKSLLFSVKTDGGLYKGDVSNSLMTMGQQLIERIRATPALGRLVISLDKSQEDRYQASMNLPLQAGDRLVVPKKSNVVVVTGEVARNASLIYQQDLTVSDYLNLSGGAGKRADTNSIFVVHGDGSIESFSDSWFSSSDSVKVLPGDTIVVPMDIERLNPLITWTSVSSILSNFAITAATLKTVGVFQ